ncbi:uncharacterized protein LOC134260942 [Saccostrea cucullata]|uniref:uncharacterized protein LOC134260942 n=1 Tax=Saccostrea cuccullata TaxID=36930 RepID=UPI002ED2F720
MGCDQICMLFCFLCCESGTPDFTKQECLDILNEIRAKAHMHLEVIKREQAQKSLDDLKRAEPNFFEKDFQNITRDATDEILYRLIWEFKFSAIYLCNYHTIHMFLRLSSYEKEPEEKCVLNKNQNFDSCLIHRLQLDILTHKTIKDTDMCNEISQILHVPGNIIKESKVRREEFVRNLQQCGEKIYDRSRTHHKSQHVKWLKKYYRLKTVRSCIGLHHHSDIYIINTQAYREHSVYHDFSSMERCLIYSLLFAEEYKIKLNHDTSKRILTKIRDAFFPKHSLPRDNCKMPKPIVKNKNGELTFISADIRHKVMYAFVTECLIEDDDLEFFLTEAPKNVIFEYCRSWNYKRKDGERCLYVPTDMYDRLIEKLDLDIIKHCTLSDWTFQNSVAKKLNVPLEILNWHQKVREQYVEYARKETHTVHHSRCMLVGCAGAGKTTLLKRLLKHSEDNILHVTTTEGLEIHEDILEISGEFFKGRT